MREPGIIAVERAEEAIQLLFPDGGSEVWSQQPVPDRLEGLAAALLQQVGVEVGQGLAGGFPVQDQEPAPGSRRQPAGR